MGFWYNVQPKSNFFYTFVQKTKFLDFWEGVCHMTSQKPNIGYVGTLSMVKGDSKVTIDIKITIIQYFVLKL